MFRVSCLVINQDVIKIDYNEFRYKGFEDLLHHSYKGARCAQKSKGITITRKDYLAPLR